MRVHHHALLLSRGAKTIAGHGDARRRYDEHLHARISSRKLERRGIIGIWKLVREAHIGLTRTERERDGVAALTSVNGGLVYGHAHRGSRGDLAKRGVFGDVEIEFAFGT